MPFPGQNIVEFYRREAEKLKPPEPVYVRVKAPPGIGAVQTLSGRHITIGEDRDKVAFSAAGIIESTLQAAEIRRAAGAIAEIW
jgi:hypothetical protein